MSVGARLGDAPATIGELAAPHAMSLPAVSKHVRVLERAGLVKRQVDGRVHGCALDTGPLLDAEAWIRERRDFWEGTLASLEQHVRAEDSRGRGT